MNLSVSYVMKEINTYFYDKIIIKIMAKHNEIGKTGENIAVKYLKNKDFIILDRNFHIKGGEIDIIATKIEECLHVKHQKLVFVEVKTKKVNENYNFKNDIFSPENNLTQSKRQKILKTIKHYLSFKKINETDMDIKIMAIIVFLNEETKQARIKMYEEFIL